ncbi:MAG TPA: tetratricopeptide repeat protein [Bryobacteraceae bacterium]|nr:tetratricopeptide repeat protein [Bryobacteraceae bacterium]
MTWRLGFVFWLVVCACAQTAGPSAIQTHYQRAQAALARSQYDVAAAEFAAILRIDPGRAEIHANLGTVYYAQGRYSEASAAFKKALQWKPSLKGADAFLGMSEARQGRAKEALPLLEKGFRDPISDQWKLEAGLLLAGIYQRTGETVKLQGTIAILQRDFPTNTEALYLSYRVHSSLGARAVADLVKAAPDSARLHQITAELLEAEGDFTGAVAQYRKALEMEPKLPGGSRALGVALMNNVNDEASRREAQTCFERELVLDPNDGLSEYQLGELLWLSGRREEALRHFTRAIELQPNFPHALIAAGKVMIASGQALRAVELLERAVAVDASNEVAHYRLAQAYQKLGNQQRASQELAEFRRLRSALESLRGIYRQIQENHITSQKVDQE